MPTVKATIGPGTKAYNRYAYYLAMANGVDTRVPNRTRYRKNAEKILDSRRRAREAQQAGESCVSVQKRGRVNFGHGKENA